jgi:hypothetical protein
VLNAILKGVVGNAIELVTIADADVFVAPQPFPSWTLDSNHDWQPPTPKPEGNYVWFEPNQVWIEIDEP